jgi:hypothetical protein
MNFTTAIVMLETLISLALLVVIILRIWPEQRTDLFRQEMFALRDELFDFAVADKVSFDDPAYILLRQLMNGFIRYAHNLTPYRTAMSYLHWRSISDGNVNVWGKSWNEALANISDPEVRAKLEDFHVRAGTLAVTQVLLSPGLLVTLSPAILLFLIFYWPWTTLRTKIAEKQIVPRDFLEAQAASA